MTLTYARNATLADVAELLKTQKTLKVDAVAHAQSLRFDQGRLILKGTEAVLTEDGVTMQDGIYRPTAVFDEGLSEKLGIPLVYVRRMRDERPDLYDLNANGWLEADERKFLVRAFQGGDAGTEGVARALLSDSYKSIDNLDVLVAVLEGVKQSGADVNIVGADLSERRMRVRMQAPGIQALAPTLLKGYRSPFDGVEDEGRRQAMLRHGYIEPGEEPVVFAGFEFSNSETGCGAFTVVPRLIVKVCTNGLTISQDALRAVHLGGKLDEGIVKWSSDTQRKNLELIQAKTTDAISTFLDADYVKEVVARLEEKAGTPIKNPADDIKLIGKKMLYTQEQTNGILDHFIKGGQVNAAGVLNAVTSFAQTVRDADTAADLEASAVKAFEFAASL